MKLDSLLARLDGLEGRLLTRGVVLLAERYDARRKSPEGQLGLDFGGGGGQKCGQGWIAPDLTCHKGAGPAPMEARRSRPVERVAFEHPIEGPSGARLVGYTWQWTMEEAPDSHGEIVEKRVSDWEKSIANVETGRNVVHQFEVETDGGTRVVSAESAIKLLGFVSSEDKKTFGSVKSAARTVARLRMAQQELDQLEKRWQKDWDEVELSPKPPVEVGEWSPEPPGFPREGYRRRTWKAGGLEVEQIWNSLGRDSDEDQAAHLFARWKANEMEKRGWDYKGQRKRSMASYLRVNRDDLAKRLARAEAKVQSLTRLDAADPIDALIERVARLDARRKARPAPGQLALDLSASSKLAGKGKGKACGSGWIRPDYDCHKGASGGSESSTGLGRFMELHKATQERKAREAAELEQRRTKSSAESGAGPAVSLSADGQVLINGKPPKKALGGGAYGDTFMAETPDGPVVVKVDRLKNQDPMERDYNKPQEQQRRNMVERELANMQKAHELGLAPEPLGGVQELPDGRLAFAYRMVPGVKKAKDHLTFNLTKEAQEVLSKPGALANYAEGIRKIARTMADAGFEHGDMHAGNMILSANGTPNLIDWGYAGSRPAVTAVDKAIIEANSLMALGGGLVTVNSMVDRGPGRLKPDIITALRDTTDLARKAQQAESSVIKAYEKQWHADPANHLGGAALPFIREANRLTREEGIPYEEAERRVGLQPVIPPEVQAKAAAERDRIFGPDRLRRFRRTVDQHYAAWNDFVGWD